MYTVYTTENCEYCTAAKNLLFSYNLEYLTVILDTPEKKKLTRSRLLWFNDTSDNICFSESMINALGDVGYQTKKEIPKRTMDIRPECRECRMPFDISKDYLVLHCHCTTRVGHEGCLNDFDKRVKHKCPVCRQPTLKRRRISKYLFWNVKEKYKFIA